MCRPHRYPHDADAVIVRERDLTLERPPPTHHSAVSRGRDRIRGSRIAQPTGAAAYENAGLRRAQESTIQRAEPNEGT